MRASAQHYLTRSIKQQLQFSLLHNCYRVAMTRTKHKAFGMWNYWPLFTICLPTLRPVFEASNR